MKSLLVPILALIISLPGSAHGYVVGDIVNDFSLPNLAGESPSLHDHLGGIVVLNFFATWCIGCNEEAAHLEGDIWQGYQGQNVTVIAVDINEPISLVQGWVDALGITYNIWLAPDWILFQEFPGSLNIPYNVVLGPDMKIRYASIGFDLNAITGMIDTILAEGQVPVSESSWGGIKAIYR